MNIGNYLFENALMSMKVGRREDALRLLADVLRHDKRNGDAWSLRGRLEGEAGRPFNALLHHEAAVQAEPGRYEFWVNRGIDAAAAWFFDVALASFEKSLALQDSFEGHYNMANLLSTTMELDLAVEHYKAAAKIDSSNAQLHANCGVAMIATGKWREGFNEYRHRFNAPGFPPRPRFDFPIWHGEPLDGKTILLYVEQGFGDELLSLRFAKTIKDMGARVILSVRPLIYRLARTFKHADAVILQYDEPPWQPDYMSALLDVPAHADVWPQTVPASAGYLSAEDRGFFLKWPDGLKVGICWASGKRELQPEVFEIAKQKSMEFRDLAPLARPGVTLVCLQHQHSSHEELRELGVVNPMQGVQDFADTAWIIDQLDLVVTVDTAVAHLAGALGKPVWNFVRFDGIWPWMRERGKTCWYDSMTVYRQDKLFDWKPPLARLMANFDRFVDEHRQKNAA